MTLIPRKFKRTEVLVYNPDGSLLCKANYHTLMDLQCQIAEQKLEGVTYEWEGKKGSIDSKGQLSDWFYGMFDLDQKFFCKLLHLRTGKGMRDGLISDIDAMVEPQTEEGRDYKTAQKIVEDLNTEGANITTLKSAYISVIAKTLRTF